MMFDSFYSDPHFGHAAIIEYEDRPFSSLDEMNDVLIAGYNDVVKENHTCLWLGDAFLMSYLLARDIMDRLNGVKFIVPGNHDRSPASLSNIGFVVITRDVVFKVRERVVRANHYPYLNTDNRHVKQLTSRQLTRMKRKYPPRIKGEVLVHGHSHGKKRRFQNMINVGVDAWGYRPVTFNQLEKEVSKI